MNFCFEAASGPASKLIQLKDAQGNLLYPKVLGTSIPAGAVSKAQLGTDVTAILNGVATNTNLESVQNKITALEGNITTLNGDKSVAGSVDKKVADAISALVGSAPDTLNTLQKIAQELQDPSKNTATTVLDQVASKANSSDLTAEVARAKAAEKSNSDAIATINAKLLTPMITYEEVTA